jgi:hypothetical protein
MICKVQNNLSGRRLKKPIKAGRIGGGIPSWSSCMAFVPVDSLAKEAADRE